MKRGFLTATLASVLAVGCYTGEEVPPPSAPSQDTSPPITTSIAVGALVYDNWLSVQAGGTGVSLADEPVNTYVQCVSCHGWDRRGSDGGYARQIRTAAQPNAGYLVTGDNLGTRRIDGTSYSELQITHQATGRAWSEGSAVYTDPNGPVTGNKHPDYTQADGLSSQQLADLRAFLNDTATGWNTVFSAIDPADNPVGYTLNTMSVSSNAAQDGESFYYVNCFACHGAPNADSTSASNFKPGAGGLAAFLTTDGGHGKFMFRTLWGSANDANKTRAAMGSPSPYKTANVMAYVNRFVAGNSAAGLTLWNAYDCLHCHDGTPKPKPNVDSVYANVLYLNSNHRSNFGLQLRYLTEQEVANLRAYIRTL